jgi:hypothetical protein
VHPLLPSLPSLYPGLVPSCPCLLPLIWRTHLPPPLPHSCTYPISQPLFTPPPPLPSGWRSIRWPACCLPAPAGRLGLAPYVLLHCQFSLVLPLSA